MDESRARELLVAERAEVAQLLRETESAAAIDLKQDDGPGDSADAAQPLAAQADEEAVVERLRERLGAIDRALGRIEAGTYGKSLLSGQPIPPERLEADPAAELTIEEARAQHDG